jgi:hypothetical protein
MGCGNGAYPRGSGGSHTRGALLVQAGPADVRGGGMLEDLFLNRVLAGPGDGAQPPGDGGPGPAVVFQIAGG